MKNPFKSKKTENPSDYVYEVLDTPMNRKYYPDFVGGYFDKPLTYAHVRQVPRSMPERLKFKVYNLDEFLREKHVKKEKN